MRGRPLAGSSFFFTFSPFPLFALRIAAVYPFLRFPIYPLSYPHQNLAIFVSSNTLCVDEFALQVCQSFIIKIELSLECAIGDALRLLEKGNCLFDDVR